MSCQQKLAPCRSTDCGAHRELRHVAWHRLPIRRTSNSKLLRRRAACVGGLEELETFSACYFRLQQSQKLSLRGKCQWLSLWRVRLM